MELKKSGNGLSHQVLSCGLFLDGRTICGHIFEQIGDGVALGLEGCSRPRDTSGRLRINTGCMIDKVGIETAFADLFRRKITSKLIKNARNHLHVCKFTRPSKLSITKTTASRRWFSHIYLKVGSFFRFLSPLQDVPPDLPEPPDFFELPELSAVALPLAIAPALAEPL